MRWFFGRGKPSGPAAQSASGATAGGDVTLISHVGGDVTVISAGGRLPTQPGPPEIETARAQYATRVRQRYGRLDLEVLTPLREQGEHPAVHLRDVFVPQSVRADPPPVELPQELLRRLMDPTEAELLDLPPGIDRETVERVRRAYQERPPQDVLDVLTAPEHDRVVILGHPGAGKSTLARYLTLALTAPEPQQGLEALHGRLPLIVELREYAQAAWRESTFEAYLAHQYTTEGLGLPPEVLAATLDGAGPYTSLVIFDGLDELFEKDIRDAVSRRIAGFAARHPRARIVVTSREYGYQRAVLDGAGFTNFMLQDLDREQIGAFTEQWFALAYPESPEQARKLIERVTTAVDSSTSVRELAGNPLILTILAIIGRRRELPRDRRTVYEHAVDVLVEHWDPSKYLKDRQVEEHLPYLAAEDKRELLRLIARQMQEGHGGISGNHIAGPDLIKSFEEYLKDRYALPPDRAATAARVMLDQFRHRNFILSRFGGEIYGFVHRTFLEYLTATDLAHRFNHQRALSEEDLQNLFATKVHDLTWHETLLLLVGSLDERFVAGVIDRLLARRAPAAQTSGFDDTAFVEVAFVARCLGEVRRPGVLAPQSTAMVREVIRLFEVATRLGVSFFNPYETIASLGPALLALGDTWAGRDEFPRWHERWSRDERHDGGIMSVNSTEQLAVDVLASLWAAEEPPAALRIAASAVTSGSVVVRIAAARLLQRHADSAPEALDSIERCLREDENPVARSTILRVLRNDFGAAPGLSKRLALERLSRDTDANVRLTALGCLPRERPADGEVRAALEQALNDTDSGVRKGALYRLIVHSEGTRRTALIEAGLRDADPQMRLGALSAVEETAGDDPDVRVLVQDRLRNDGDAQVVAAAITVVRSIGSDDPRTHALLHDLTGHEDPTVRKAALRCLVEAGDGSHSALLSDRLVHDENDGVRDTALSLLVRNEGDDATVRDVLLARVRNDPSQAFQIYALGRLADLDVDEARELAIEQARNHPAGPVRARAIHRLLTKHADDADAVRTVFDLAAGDESPAVRITALRRLVDRCGGTPEVGDLARNRFDEDPDPGVRVAALRFIADIRRDDPGLIPLLREAAVDDAPEIRALAERLLTVLAPHPT
ncbi:HEAT repeat domain-containing protein [Streptomyces sp. NPDC056169]|uniref:HEAT repeat domain-containing protein n=1 Tax=Streptomyces sp. NPDC056169 TaxID=3345734 RepID=UPI0035DB715E